MRQPDIEIYLKDADQAAVGAWLAEALGPCSEWRRQGETFKCLADSPSGMIPLTWLPQAVGKWHSLFIDSDATPWDDDLACARAANAALGVEVRCAPGGWSEEQGEEDADRWLKVTAEGVAEITWRTG
ncbi:MULTISPECIES: hypothetical protein [Pseudomonas]|jgi:putative intracellular protease/amidase|uniref:Uncharacterized protein n=1 Tax=Pseudomonas citronellolis TaxID=53408 RepID=A0A1A9KGC1_9PSED|nr:MULTISPECIES: hypothetical protein [Pseudomonas]ANI16856.1 hypothetical protein A9C11_24045 [Pseudomonas citronellolis]KRV75238.1 hypothetical protein AO742_14155 [Pseudomonas citronellolis]KRW78981.1 hypothetical protein AO738_14145 [Pseudomonas citronellolis]KWR72743.1 hypothetical protein RN02_27705 [Pseudomonas sp. PI1]